VANNARGGVHGRQIVLQTLDDGYEIPRSLANIDKFLADPATASPCSTAWERRMVGAHAAQGAGVGHPFFAPYTGGQV
jgi:branched-chain amino acid transport system substrate-binding protein